MNCSPSSSSFIVTIFLSAKVVVTLPITFADSNTDCCYNRLTLDLKVTRIEPQCRGAACAQYGWGQMGYITNYCDKATSPGINFCILSSSNRHNNWTATPINFGLEKVEFLSLQSSPGQASQIIIITVTSIDGADTQSLTAPQHVT